MKASRCIIPVTILIALIYLSCEPIEKISEIPEIHFKSYTSVLVDTNDVITPGGLLVFSFKDGDANFGIDESETNPVKANLFLIPFQKVNSSYDSIDSAIYGRTYPIFRHEKMDRTSGNTTVKGDIELLITYFLPPPFDTIRFDFYIVDRAGNESNVESTTDIAVSDMDFQEW
jgi:hypothetical protein